MNDRVERMFGPRSERGKGDEMEMVDRCRRGETPRGAAQNAMPKAAVSTKGGGERNDGGGRTPTPTSLHSATSPRGRGKGNSRGGERAVQKALREKKAVMPGISGFVSIRCGGCQKIINTCLHEKRTAFNCRSCGHSTKLENLKSIHVLCPRCGFKGNYRTNRVGTEIQMECLNCSLPIDLRRNARGDYLPEVEA